MKNASSRFRVKHILVRKLKLSSQSATMRGRCCSSAAWKASGEYSSVQSNRDPPDLDRQRVRCLPQLIKRVDAIGRRSRIQRAETGSIEEDPIACRRGMSRQAQHVRRSAGNARVGVHRDRLLEWIEIVNGRG